MAGLERLREFIEHHTFDCGIYRKVLAPIADEIERDIETARKPGERCIGCKRRESRLYSDIPSMCFHCARHYPDMFEEVE